MKFRPSRPKGKRINAKSRVRLLAIVTPILVAVMALVGDIFLKTLMSPAEKLIAEKNRPQLSLESISNKTFAAGDDYLTLIVKNVSGITATNVLVRALGSETNIFANRDKEQEKWFPRNLAIGSSKESWFPVAKMGDVRKYVTARTGSDNILGYTLDPNLLVPGFNTHKVAIATEIEYQSPLAVC